MRSMNMIAAAVLAAQMMVISCTKEQKTSTKGPEKSEFPTSAQTDSTASSTLADEKKVQDSLLAAQKTNTFTLLTFPAKKKDSAMSVFIKNYSKEERYTILALNRLDSKNRWRADSLVVPQKVETNIMAYSPFPMVVQALADVKKIALFSYAVHAYGLYENGKLVKWGPSSMGKKSTPTKKGLMFTNWKKEVAISTSNSEWKLRWNFNVHNTMGIGWHQYDLPGHHASHSCLRLLEEDAKMMYNWADTWVLANGGQDLIAKGTPVIVYGDTNFKDRPWLKLAQDPTANNISVEEIDNLVKPHLEFILKEQANSDKVRSERKKAKEDAASASPAESTATA